MLPQTMKRQRIGTALLTLSLLGLPGLANALTCSVSATATAFGNYNPLSATNTDGTGTITVTCNNLISLFVSYDILLSTGGSGSYGTRRMASGGNNLNYNLYTSILRTTIWGDNTGGSSKVSDGYLIGVITVVRNYTVYGRIPALQNVPGGTYADSITVTLNY